jgi:hypothetical protein
MKAGKSYALPAVEARTTGGTYRMLFQAISPRRLHRASPAAGDGDDYGARPSFDRQQNPGEELPYRVELWNMSGTSVDVVLAVTASPSIGYAAYYAATREHPNRQITLRHKNSIISRWPGPGH